MDFFTNANFNSDSYDKCCICELMFKQYDLDLHFTTFHDTNMDQDLRKLRHSFEEFLCLICGRKFKTMNSMSQHVETSHQGAFICCQNHSCTLQLSHFCQSGRNHHSEVLDHIQLSSINNLHNQNLCSFWWQGYIFKHRKRWRTWATANTQKRSTSN